MDLERVVREVRVVGSVQGMDGVEKAYRNTADGADKATAATEKNTKALISAADAIEKQQLHFQDLYRQQQKFIDSQVAYQRTIDQARISQVQATAANDNLSKSLNNATNSGSSFLSFMTKLALGLAATALGVGLLYTAFKILYEIAMVVPRALGEAWDLGGKKLDEYRQIAEKAAAVDLSTDYFQRITKSATDAKLPVADLTEALKSLAKVSTEKLGGSDLQNRIDASVKAGNFAGNSGVAQYASANTQEEKFRAIVNLIDQAMIKGERLAALDISSKAFGPAITANLQKDSEYLTRMVASADKIAATELVSAGDIGRALTLQNSYDAAVKILEVRWHPVQDLLTAAGIKMHEIWVGIVVSIANAVDWATRLVEKISEAKLPPQVVSWLNRASAADMENATPDSTRIPETASAADLAAIKATNERTDAVARLTAGLQNKNAVEQAAAQVNAVQNSVWRDTSKNIDDQKKALDDTSDAYDRARDAAQKHYAQTNADSDAIGLGIGAQAEFKTKAALTTAALIAQREMTPQLTAEIDAYGKAARTAAEANERLKIAAQIKFNSSTVFLSPQDVQIAQQLKGLFPDIATALKSPEAEAIRLNDLLRQTNDIAGAAASGFAKDIANSVLPMEAFANAAKRAAESVLDIATKKIASNMLGGLLGDTASQATGATTAAGILTSAGATVAASIVAGATQAASILGLTIPPAAATLPAAGVATGTAVAAGGVTAGAAVTAGGAAVEAASFSLSAAMGPIGVAFAAMAAIAAAVGLSGHQSSGDKWLQGQIEGMNTRAADYAQRSAMVGVDSSTRAGKIQSFDFDFEQEKEKREAA